MSSDPTEDAELNESMSADLLISRHMLLSALGDVGVLDGDSLLQLLVSEGSLLSWTHGGQFLHLVELYERFLLQFVRRNVKMRLVFFPQSAWLWQSDAALLLIRRSLIDHLRHRCASPLLEIMVFPHGWHSTEWRLSVAELDPNWLMCFDETAAPSSDARNYFRAFTKHHQNVMHLNAVLVPGLEFRGNDVEAWISLPVRSAEPPDTTGPWTQFEDSVWHRCVADAPTAAAAVRDAVAIASRDKNADAAVLTAVVACVDAFPVLPLTARVVAAPLPVDDKIVKTVRILCSVLYPDATAQLIDLIDGRFLHHVVRNQIDLKALCISSASGSNAAAPVAAVAAAAEAVAAVSSVAAPAAAPDAVPDSWDALPVADSWDAAPADSWMNLDLAKIDAVVEAAPVAVAAAAPAVTAAAAAAPAVTAAAAAAPVAAAKTSVSERLGKDIVLGEPKKKAEKKTKREMKGEQRAAHIETLQAKSLCGRYVQQHVITLDRRQVKESHKTAKIKEAAAGQERAKQEETWKDWLQKHSAAETELAHTFVKDNEFHEDIEFRILLELCQRAPSLELAMPIVAELVFRKCDKLEHLAVVAEKWGFTGLGAQLRKTSTAPDAKWVRRQLIDTGELLPREVGEADPRVKHFRPDPWQKKLLDYVDDNRSCVVVAPTSAGKTFIQYYVMEKVLREDDSSVVVYVCPTKPLCHQVFAGVNARFQKAYSSSSSVLCGIFLRDRSQRADTCQILITVPDCLDVLLLSPTKAGQNWAKKIKWILFDEVHTINDPVDGPVWERILQLTTCPFLALSATVGQPEAFRSWLSGTRKESVELIVHSERYNDLRTFVARTEVAAAKPDENAPAASKLLALHPCTFVSTELLAKEGFPSLADFESKDTFELWEKMVEADASAKDLAPELFFTEPIISRQRAKQWAADIKARLVQWARERPAACERVLTAFTSRVRPSDVLLTGRNDEEKALFDLTQELLRDGPVLLFTHYRPFCESMVGYYVKKLEEMQAAAAPSAKKQKEQNRKAEHMAKDKKHKEKRSKNRKEQEEAERYGEADVETVVAVDEQYPVEFTLRRGNRKGLGKEDRESLIHGVLIKTQWPKTHPLIQGLRRGIGCHHEGMPHRYRVAVELMFRTGDLTVVFATQTLAQGIHAPARSVVLVHDAVSFLTPTSLRQMTGRAGRRGYDLIGQVVFYGVQYRRIRQLLHSRVPQIRGGFPLSASLALRLVMLQNSGASSKELIDAQVQQLLNQPLLSQGGRRPELDGLLRHYFDTFGAFCFELGLLTPTRDRAVWLAALASHLSYLDPSNLLFVYCFGERLLDRICNVEDPTLPGPQEQLLALLACVLQPVVVHPTFVEKYKNRQGTAYASAVVMQVPESIRAAVRAFNSLAIRVFISASPVSAPQAPKLPLSRFVVGPASCNAGVSPVSAFAQLSGVSEAHLDTLDRVVFGTRNDLCVDHTAVPVVPDHAHINSFVLDFYRQLEPNVDEIRSRNALPKAWFKLSDFSQTLRVIAVALAKLHEHYDSVMDSNIYRMLAEDSDPVSTNTVEKSDPAPIKAAKRSANAVIHLSAEFQKRFQKTKH